MSLSAVQAGEKNGKISRFDKRTGNNISINNSSNFHSSSEQILSALFNLLSPNLFCHKEVHPIKELEFKN